ncbi:MAG: RagB/SusD family nutrient uptake outer membrane protein [Bacteroidota bacterium]
MTTTMNRARRAIFTLLLPMALVAPLALTASGCDLTVEDTNATTEDDAFGTRAGLLAAVVGLQSQYNQRYFDTWVISSGITSRELAADNTFANLLDLEAGGPGLDPANANVTNYFREMYQTISTADAIIDGAASTEGLEDDLRASLTAVAQFYKAAAIGALALGFTDVALETNEENQGVYSSRDAALAEAVSLLQAAESGLAGGVSGALPVPAEFDLVNSVRAYLARFALYAGDFSTASSAAGRVDPSVTSTFAFSATEGNPLYEAISPALGQPSFAVRDDLGLETVVSGDGRIDTFTETNEDTSVNGFPIETATGFIASGLATSIPVYVPDEMVLIQAEAAVRDGQTAAAVAFINQVRTDADDPFGLAANLPPYTGPTDQASLLQEIFYNRSVELYLQGLRLPDQRRFGLGTPDPTNSFSRTRDFYPFPQQERLANPDNTPADPSI